MKLKDILFMCTSRARVYTADGYELRYWNDRDAWTSNAGEWFSDNDIMNAEVTHIGIMGHDIRLTLSFKLYDE